MNYQDGSQEITSVVQLDHEMLSSSCLTGRSSRVWSSIGVLIPLFNDVVSIILSRDVNEINRARGGASQWLRSGTRQMSGTANERLRKRHIVRLTIYPNVVKKDDE